MYDIYTCPVPSKWCPVCGKVLKAADALGVPYRRKTVWQPRPWRRKIIELSGQRLVPLLVDEEKGFVMNESGDIVRYLREQHGGASSAGGAE
jgi:glutaredoxin 3